MKNETKNILFLIIVTVLLVTILLLFANRSIKVNDKSFFTQADFMEDLANTELNMSNAKDVFGYVFKRLDNEVTIYQSENNLYLRFAAHGKVFGGIITLAVLTRDKGVISLSYIERAEDPATPQRLDFMGGGGLFNETDGAIVRKVDDWTYKVTFEGKTVVFHLYNPGMDPPKKAKLLKDEEYVGPVFDESGIEMYLIFNNATSSFYLLLNEDRYVREQFRGIGYNVLVGERTSFAFYNDSINNRKILIGVKGENTMQKNWYDGPHDQMPDNYIHLDYIPRYKYYLESAYPYYKGRIDKYGHFLEKDSGRVAVAPYTVYFSEEDLTQMSLTCNSLNSANQIYSCLTAQVYDIPDNKRYLLGN